MMLRRGWRASLTCGNSDSSRLLLCGSLWSRFRNPARSVFL